MRQTAAFSFLNSLKASEPDEDAGPTEPLRAGSGVVQFVPAAARRSATVGRILPEVVVGQVSRPRLATHGILACLESDMHFARCQLDQGVTEAEAIWPRAGISSWTIDRTRLGGKEWRCATS
jgi:hypothetical protein